MKRATDWDRSSGCVKVNAGIACTHFAQYIGEQGLLREVWVHAETT